MRLSFAKIAAICGKFDREDNNPAKATTALRFAISREYLQEFPFENAQEVDPGLGILLGCPEE